MRYSFLIHILYELFIFYLLLFQILKHTIMHNLFVFSFYRKAFIRINSHFYKKMYFYVYKFMFKGI